jgi:hypothetical protein
MTDSNSNLGKRVGIHKVTNGNQTRDTQNDSPVSKILQTQEVRQLLNQILPDILGVFTKDTQTSKFIMKHVGKFLVNQTGHPNGATDLKDLQDLLHDEKFIADMGAPLPGAVDSILDSILDIIGILMKSFKEMPEADRVKTLKDVISKISTGKTGTMLTELCVLVNDMHKTDPTFLTESIEPAFKKWIESVDFGEIRELFDTSGEEGRKFIAMMNDVMWEYPTKMIMTLSFLPSLLNLLIDASGISVAKFNELPPDMLSDVIIAYVGEINTDALAGTVNQLTELVRKVHNGSALIGDPGSPQLIKTLSKMIEDVVENTDPVTFWKAKTAIAETTAAIDEAVAKAVALKPAFKHLEMIRGPEILNIRYKSLNRKLSAWEAVDDEDLAKSMEQHLTAYDVQEMAEVLNNTFRIINRLGDGKPEVFNQIAGQFVNALDEYELSETANRLFNGVSEEFKPVARAVVPGLVTWICDVLKPCDDEYEDQAAKARESLQSLFATQEV